MAEELFARFAGMKMAEGMPRVRGPFLVRVYRDKSKRPVRCRAELLPTKQHFRGPVFDKLSMIEQVQGAVASLFEEKLMDWTEERPAL